MKKLFYRLSSSRSFTKLFSMQARLEERRTPRSYRNLISAVIIAAFGFCFSGEARAQEGCDNPDFCFDFGFPSTIDNFTGSNVQCTLLPGGTSDPINKLDIIGTLGQPTAIFTQDGTADCTYKATPSSTPTDLGTCNFHLEMTGVTTSTCNAATNSFTAGAFCQDKTLQVDGFITGCSKVSPPTKVLNLGIGGRMATNGSTARNKNNCENVFPADPEVTGLPAGKVLDLTIRTQGSAAGSCTGPFVAISNVKERWCNGGAPNGDFTGAEVNCVSPTGVKLTSQEANAPAVPFDFNVRQTVNTSPCTGGKGDQDRGKANFDISGSNTFNVNNIAVNTLVCEGQNKVVCGAATDLNGDGFLDLPCQIATCPNFGPALADPNATEVAATCTGQLKPVGTAPGTQILGTDPSVRIN